jgi:hypothetical protein
MGNYSQLFEAEAQQKPKEQKRSSPPIGSAQERSDVSDAQESQRQPSAVTLPLPADAAVSPTPIRRPLPISQSTGQLVDRPTSQSITQSTTQSTNPLPHIPTNKIVGRPKAFYITERLDARLDAAVKYVQEKHGIKKVDRSTIVNALLDTDDNWTEESLDLLVSRIISLLTSRLTS